MEINYDKYYFDDFLVKLQYYFKLMSNKTNVEKFIFKNNSILIPPEFLFTNKKKNSVFYSEKEEKNIKKEEFESLFKNEEDFDKLLRILNYLSIKEQFTDDLTSFLKSKKKYESEIEDIISELKAKKNKEKVSKLIVQKQYF